MTIKSLYKSFVPKSLQVSLWHCKNRQAIYGLRYIIHYCGERLKLAMDDILKRPKRLRCACCGASVSRFVEFIGYDFLPGALRCPGCGSMPRHRFLHVFLKKEILPRFDKPVLLRYSPEPFFEDLVSECVNIAYFSTDICRKNDKRVSFLSDAQRIPVVSGTIDLAISVHVLEHLPDDMAAVREIRRVLTTKGVALVMVPQQKVPKTVEFPCAKADEHYHYRRYGEDFVARLREVFGGCVRVVDARIYSGYDSDEYSSEKLYLCSKDSAIFNESY